jgi:hypothetical protein
MYNARLVGALSLIPLVGSFDFRIHPREVVVDVVLLLVCIALWRSDM